MSHLTIGLSLSATWLRGSAWQHADSRVEELFCLEPYLEAARLAEDAHLDFLFKPDALSLDPTVLAATPGFSSLDPIVMMAALAHATSHIGLVPTVSATYAHPHTTARQLQSLDQLTGGRVGWNVVTSLGGAENFAEQVSPADLYANADDFVRVVEDLRQTFPAHALTLDRDRGVFAATEHLTQAAPRGRYASAGPLTVPATSAGPWPLLHAGGSAASTAFARTHADAVFAMTIAPAQAKTLRSQLDRDDERGPVRVLPGLSLCLAPTRAEARALAAASGTAPAHVRHWSVIGTPQDAAEAILRWRASGSIDGFIALPYGSWRSIELLCAEVIPLLVEAGAFRDSYREQTLRGHLTEQAAGQA